MKFKNSAVIFSLILMFSIFNLPFVPAPSHPEFVGECGAGTFHDFINDECRSPEFIGEVESSGFFGGTFEGIRYALSNTESKARLSALFTAEEITQFEQALADGDYESVEKAAGEIGRRMSQSSNAMENYYGGVDPGYYDYITGIDEGSVWIPISDAERAHQQNIAEIERSKDNILRFLADGKLTQEQADKIINGMSGPEKLSTIIAHSKYELMQEVVADSDGQITLLEMEYRERANDDAIGFTELHYKDSVSRDDIAENKYILDSLKKEIIESDERDFAEVDELFMQARMAQQDARDALVNEDYKEAHESFQEAGYLIRIIDDYNREGNNVLNNVHEDFDKTFEEINQEVEEENKQIIEDYETEGVKEKIIETYPEYKTELHRTYDGAVKINDTTMEMELLRRTTAEDG
ncbi:hypothetical protein HYS72_03485 [Candidatus Pacearchaeota archaeon]|nr:hypothetical protein [Candidatus Pacearchaeota archaeon]